MAGLTLPTNNSFNSSTVPGTPTTSNTPTNTLPTNNPNANIVNYGNVQGTPVAQSPATPSPTLSTPTAPAATAAPTTPPATATPTTPVVSGSNTANPAQTTTGQPLAMPASGSVVDLLNSAGQDSSFANRTSLAKQYGIAGYTGTAQQNQDLSKKYLDAFNANKGTTVPGTGAQASSALGNYFKDNAQTTAGDAQANFMDALGSMNPVVKSMYDAINQSLSSIGTQQTFQQQYQDLTAQQGIPALQTQLMDVNNIMNGTESDIRDEITKAGGFATESQVQALTGARNKTLLTQANSLQQQLSLKQDYVNQIMQFSQADRADVQKQIDQKLGLTTQLVDLQDKMNSAAQNSLSNVQKSEGWDGIYKAAIASGNPQAVSYIESVMGPGFSLAAAAQQDAQARTNAAQTTQLDTQQKIASINSSNASTNSSNANTQKTLQDINNTNGVPNPAKANAPGYDASGVKYTTATAANELTNEIKTQGLTGTAHLLTPGVFNQMEAWWVSQNLPVAEFKAEFGGYIDQSKLKQYN